MPAGFLAVLGVELSQEGAELTGGRVGAALLECAGGGVELRLKAPADTGVGDPGEVAAGGGEIRFDQRGVCERRPLTRAVR